MNIIPAHRPVVIVVCLRIAALGIVEISIVVSRKIKPRACPCKFVVKSAPGIVETVRGSVSCIGSRGICKLIQTLGMLETKRTVIGIGIFENNTCGSKCGCCFSRYCGAGVVRIDKVRGAVHGHDL